MNAGLTYLLRKQSVGTFRALRRKLRGLKGLVAGLAFGLFVAAILLPRFLARAIHGIDEERALATAESIRLLGPPGLFLGLAFFGISSKALYFKPAEVDFLFAAPVSRRDLVLFNVLARLRVQLMSAIWCSVFFVSWAGSWYAALFGSFFLFALMQLTAQMSGLLFSTASEALGSKLRRVGCFALAIALLAGLLSVRGTVGSAQEIFEAVRALAAHPVARGLSLITLPFVEVFLSRGLGDILFWSSLSVVILLLQIFLIVFSDTTFSESSLAASQKVQARLRRMRSEGSTIAAASPGSARWSIPPLPRLGGAGVLAWRQGLEMIRHLKSILLLLVIAFFPVFPFILSDGLAPDPATRPEGGTVTGGERAVQTAALGLVLMTIFFAQNTSFDFRRDLDRMVTFKSLPLRRSAIAAGQILPMAFLLSCVQCLGLALLAYLSGGVDPGLATMILLGLLPFNWNAVAIDNAVFLFFPYRITPEDTGNLPFMGRMMITMLLKMLLLLLLAAIAAGIGGGVSYLTGGAEAAVGLAIVAFFVAIAFPMTHVVSVAFDRFDVSRDI